EITVSNSSSLHDLLPLLLLGGDHHQDLLPLLLLLGGGFGSSSSSSSSESRSGGDDPTSIPTSFAAYAAGLVGEIVRVSVVNAVDNAIVIVGKLEAVGSDFILLRDASAGGISLGFRERLSIPLDNVGAIERVPYILEILPFLLRSGSGW
ncbi:hypothetical protein, partial [Methylacidiphilum caldifontis]|uniref:hypothetical protein n=1 Tax=Methylacidiphilum caldifontis TaxID=2795386 RepID=UPI001ABC61C0